MASASSLQFSLTFRSSSSSSYLSNNNHLFLGFNTPSLLLRHRRSSPTVLALSRRRRNNNSAITPKSPAKRNKSLGRSEREDDDDDIGEDAFEALFRQLEEDLKNDELPVTDEDDDISEEDLMSLERELEEVIGDEELLKVLDSAADESSTEVDDVDDDDDDDDDEEEGEEDEDDEHDEFEDEYEDEDEDDDEDERPVLKNWQLRRLAYALKKGRRKTNIKMLAAEICVDRAIVLEYLREPPPSLLMLSATLPDEPVPEISEPATEQLETVPLETEIGEEAKQEPKGKVPVHMMQNNWSAQKRLKKVHIETLERIYRRTKRPTNSMVSNIVHVTNLPRKRVVKWFEDRRAEESVPEHRVPYKQAPDSETVPNS